MYIFIFHFLSIFILTFTPENEKAIKEAVTHFEIILWYAIKNLIEKIEIL